MATIRFNLHDALAEVKIQEVIDLVPEMGPFVEDLRAMGMTAKKKSQLKSQTSFGP